MQIFSNLAISLDGKIGFAKRGLYWLGTPEDRREMLRIRARADAVIFGASTFRSHPKRIPGRMNVLVSRTLRGIQFHGPEFRDPKTPWVIFCGPGRAKALSEKVLPHVRVIEWTGAKAAVSQLRRLGVRALLVEGGGEIMWEFVKYRLIREFHVTLTPKILGGSSAPTLVDGAGFSPGRELKLKLLRARPVKNEIFLTYRAV